MYESLANALGRVPKLEVLVPIFFSRYQSVRLIAGGLTNDGKTAVLLPMQPSEDLQARFDRDRRFINVDSLPTLDLTVAEVEWDRREETILRSVNEFLGRYRFVAKTADKQFFELLTHAMLPMDSLLVLATIGGIKLQVNLPLTRLTVEEASKSLAETVHQLPQSSLTLTCEEEVRGLDLSKTVRAWRGEIYHMLLPTTCIERKLLDSAVDCQWAGGELAISINRAEEHWFFSRLPRSWKNHQLAKRLQSLEAALGQFETYRLQLS